MTVSLRSHVSVRSYYFRELCLQHERWLEDYTLADFRPLWRAANRSAVEWRRCATNIWNHSTKQWEQRT